MEIGWNVFFDTFLIDEENTTAERRLHKPIRREVLLTMDRPWEGRYTTIFSVIFTEGNGEDTCDKVKIAAGDLNDRITATWHDGGGQWSWYLHFKYKNHPETLVVNDHNGLATEFTTTDLDDALSVRNTKRMKEY